MTFFGELGDSNCLFDVESSRIPLRSVLAGHRHFPTRARAEFETPHRFAALRTTIRGHRGAFIVVPTVGDFHARFVIGFINAQQRTALFQIRSPVPVGTHSVVPHAREAFGQNVGRPPPYKLDFRNRDRNFFFGLTWQRVFFAPRQKRDLPVLPRHQTRIGNRTAADIAGQVLENHNRIGAVGRWRLHKHTEPTRCDAIQPLFENCRVSQPRQSLRCFNCNLPLACNRLSRRQSVARNLRPNSHWLPAFSDGCWSMVIQRFPSSEIPPTGISTCRCG